MNADRRMDMESCEVLWRSEDGRVALGRTRRGFVLGSDLGVTAVAGWRAQLFLAVRTVERLVRRVVP